MKLNKSKCKACFQYCSKIDKSESTNVSPILLRRIQCIIYATWRFGHTLNSKHATKTNNQDSSRYLSDRQAYSRFFSFLFPFFPFFYTSLFFSRDRRICIAFSSTHVASVQSVTPGGYPRH